MAMSFKTCPVCGKEPIILKEELQEEAFYIARCPDNQCEMYNDDTFDDLQACCDSWNGKVKSYLATHFSPSEV